MTARQSRWITSAVFATAIACLAMTGCQPAGSVLRGRLSLADGSVAAGVSVAVYSDVSQTVVANTASDAQGDYSFMPSTLPDGTYRILFDTASWWQNADTWNGATPVTMSASTPATINATVAQTTGSVSGTAWVGTSPQPNVHVDAINLDNNASIASRITSSAGTYSFAALPIGRYRFRFTSSSTVTVYNGSAATQDAAPVVTVTDGSATTGVDATTTLSSVITGSVTNGTAPLAGIVAFAYDPTTGAVVGAATTSSDGTFTIPNLVDGPHTVGFLDSTQLMRARILGTTSSDPTQGRLFTPFQRKVDVGSVGLVPTTVPAKPTISWISKSGDGILFEVNGDDGGRPITGYTVTAYKVQPAKMCIPTATDQCIDFVRQDPSCETNTTLCTFSWSLSDDYVFTFTATNANGESESSDYSRQLYFGHEGCHGLIPGSSPGRMLLSSQDLSDCDLANIDFGNSLLDDAILNRSTLAGARLDQATLTGVVSSGIVGTPAALPGGWKVIGGFLIGPGAKPQFQPGVTDLSNSNFSGVDLTGVDLSGVTLTGVVSSGVTGTPAALPTGWVLAGGHLIGPGVSLAGVDLLGADLAGVRSGGITGTPARMPANWLLKDGYLFGPGADLTNADLSGMTFDRIGVAGNYLNLSQATLTGAKLTGTTFTSGVTLTGVRSGGVVGTPAALPTGWLLVNGTLVGPGVDLTGMNLAGRDLRMVNLSGANLTSADLSLSNLTGVDLENANLTGTNLAGTHLGNADMTGAHASGVTGTPADLPRAWSLTVGTLVGPGADLRDDDLAGANLAGVDLSGANLSGVRSGGITGTPAGLPVGWKVVNGYLIGPGANLQGADLGSGNYLGTTLTGVRSGGILGTPASLPPATVLIDGYLVGPGVDLTGADLSGMDLTGVSLTGATLTGVQSGGITAPTSLGLPSGWTFVNGYLVGPGAMLASANLAGVNLSPTVMGATDLTGANLNGAILTGANLNGVVLEGTDLTHANLSGVIASGIIGTPAALPIGWTLVGGTLVGPS